MLNYPEMTQAFYVVCGSCTEHFEEVPSDKQLCDSLAEDFKEQHEAKYGGGRESSTRAGSMTDATTIETPGANTPIILDDDIQITGTKKRKLVINHNMDRASVKSQRRE